MCLFKYKKGVPGVVMLYSVFVLSGCAGLFDDGSNQPAVSVPSSSSVTPVPPQVPVQHETSQPYISPPKDIKFDNNEYKNNENNDEIAARDNWLTPQSTCIRQLDSLKKFSPPAYKEMVNEFKDISKINALYHNVKNTGSRDMLALLKMSIESKTEVLCAKVRYLSVMSVNSTLKKLGE